MNDKINSITKELRGMFEKSYGNQLAKMFLYGSQARGDSYLGSDIDILVVLKGKISQCEEIERTIDIVSDISLKYNELIACFFVSEERFIEANDPLIINVQREGILV